MKCKRTGVRPDAEKASLQEQRNTLKREIDRWRDIQHVYMPGVAALQGTDTDPDAHLTDKDERPETSKLCLPSAIPVSHRDNACVPGIVDKEKRLRMAQLQDALVELCRARRVRKGAALFFDIHIAGTGQRPVTRHLTTVHTIDNRITRAVHRYRDARDAMRSLDPRGEWKKEFHELKDEDNRGPGRESDDSILGEGSFVVSWIWLAPGATSRTVAADTPISIEEVNEGMRVEWARTLARADRWAEEAKLLVSEMERVLKFLEWKADWWISQKGLRSAQYEISNGLDAFANSQAAVYRNLALTFARRWVPLLDKSSIERPWASRYIPIPSNPTLDTSTLTTLAATTLPQSPPSGHRLNASATPFAPSSFGAAIGHDDEVESDGSSDSDDSGGSEDEGILLQPPPGTDTEDMLLDCS